MSQIIESMRNASTFVKTPNLYLYSVVSSTLSTSLYIHDGIRLIRFHMVTIMALRPLC